MVIFFTVNKLTIKFSVKLITILFKKSEKLPYFAI